MKRDTFAPFCERCQRKKSVRYIFMANTLDTRVDVTVYFVCDCGAPYGIGAQYGIELASERP